MCVCGAKVCEFMLSVTAVTPFFCSSKFESLAVTVPAHQLGRILARSSSQNYFSSGMLAGFLVQTVFHSTALRPATFPFQNISPFSHSLV